MENRQTAVEWLESELRKLPFVNVLDVFEQAKAMEKEHIKYAFGQGSLFDPVFPDHFHDKAEEYYQYHYEK
jgi:hypothetical protein